MITVIVQEQLDPKLSHWKRVFIALCALVELEAEFRIAQPEKLTLHIKHTGSEYAKFHGETQVKNLASIKLESAVLETSFEVVSYIAGMITQFSYPAEVWESPFALYIHRDDPDYNDECIIDILV